LRVEPEVDATDRKMSNGPYPLQECHCPRDAAVRNGNGQSSPLCGPSTIDVWPLGRDLEHLTGLDVVGIGQLIAVRLEDACVGAGIPQGFLGDLAERVTRRDRVGP
jgi:hypothetical protein